MKKQFAIIGMGKFGTALAIELSQMGHDVLAIDRDEKRLEEVDEYVTHSLILNAVDESALRSVGLADFDVVIIAIGDDLRSSIMSCMIAKEAGAPYVVAKSNDELHSKILKKIGVDKVVFPEADMGVKMAHSLASDNVLEMVRLSDEYSMSEILVPEIFVGKTLSELNVRAKYGLNVTAVRTGDAINAAPGAGYCFKEGDIMVVIASKTSLVEFENNVLVK